MVDAIAVQPDKSPSFCVDDRMLEPKDLLRICSSLVILVQRLINDDEDDCKPYYSSSGAIRTDGKREVNELRLAHFSVKEYLVSYRVVQSFLGHLAEATARAKIATICLTYLRDLDYSLSLKQMETSFLFA